MRECDRPLISVVILNRNGVEELPVCIESLKEQTIADRMEILVADNGSTDNSREVALKMGATFLSLGGNHGFGKGNNLGAEHARGKHLFFVNNDMRFEPDCVWALARVLQDDDTVFCADARQHSWDGERLIHGRTVLRPASFWWFQYPRMRVDPAVPADAPVDVPTASGANLMARRSMFEKLGGFDSTFFLDFEDLDLCWRAWLRGWRTVHVPEALVFHKVGTDSQQEGERQQRAGVAGRKAFRQYSYLRNQVRFAMKLMPLRDNVLVFLRQHLLFFFHLLFGERWLALLYPKAWWSNALRLREILRLRHDALAHAVTDSESIRRRFWVE